MVTIIEPSFRAYGCDSVNRRALRQRSSKLTRGLRYSDATASKPLRVIPEKMETLYLSAYIYGRPLARKLESVVNFFPPALSSLNCSRTSSEKSTDHLPSSSSSEDTESIISHRHTSLSQDPKTPATTIMESRVHKLVWAKYRHRHDIIHEYIGYFKNNDKMVGPYAPNASDADFDMLARRALKYIQGTREEIILATGKEPIDFDMLDDLLREAQSVHSSTTFHIRRHYQGKDEGLRLRQEHNIAQLERRSETAVSFVKDRLISAIRTLRAHVDKNTAEMFKRRDSRIKALDKAMDRVEKSHRLAVVNATILRQQ